MQPAPPDRRPILIAGPTASGKSALAVALARRLRGAVINADSQQVYRDWRVLSARPSPAEEAVAPHLLYGHVPIGQAYSVGAWLADIEDALAHCAGAGLVPILVGGTGLYFTALIEGLAPVPPIPAEIRAEGARLLTETGLAGLVERLATLDPETTRGLDLANPARVLRAWEVVTVTGRGLASWQSETAAPLMPPGAARGIALMPDRDWLHDRIARRFDAMMAEGALDEIARVSALTPVEAPSGLKLAGAAELRAHLRGEMTLDEAVMAAKTVTRRYAKRQLTWIRNRLGDWPRLTLPCPEDADLADLAECLMAGDRAG